MSLEMISKLTLIVLVCFMIYLDRKGSKMEERSLMSVGYAMIAVILVNAAINLLCYLVSAVGSLLSALRKCLRKRRNAYEFTVQPSE